MTLKQKAESIHTKMYFIISNNGQFTGEHSIPHKWEEAKKCSIIAIDEVIEAIDATGLHTAYWQEIKEQINKL